MRNHTRATVYFSADIFKALRMKAAATNRSISDMVNEAVRDALAEDAPISMQLLCFVTMRSPRTIHLFLACDDVARYKILLKATVAREYEEIGSKRDRRRVLWTIAALADDPRPAKFRTLPDREDHHRICLGHYRVVYRIDDRKKQVTVFRIAHRRHQHSAW